MAARKKNPPSHRPEYQEPKPRRRLNKGDMRGRYAISNPTISRWVTQGKLPKPHYLYRRPFWWLDELEAHDAAHTESFEERAANLRDGAEGAA